MLILNSVSKINIYDIILIILIVGLFLFIIYSRIKNKNKACGKCSFAKQCETDCNIIELIKEDLEEQD